jgi:hypothetical protein
MQPMSGTHLVLSLDPDKRERELLLCCASLCSNGCPADGKPAVCHMLLLTPLCSTLLHAPLQLH